MFTKKELKLALKTRRIFKLNMNKNKKTMILKIAYNDGYCGYFKRNNLKLEYNEFGLIVVMKMKKIVLNMMNPDLLSVLK